jgi:hypothetical protein
MKELTNLDPQTKISHHAITIVLGTKARVDDHALHHQSTITTHDMKETEDLNLQSTHTTMKTTKRRWEHHALLTEFAGHLYSKDLNYPMISKNTTDLRNHGCGCQIIYKK